MYEYNATVLRVVDGDTVDLRVDLGFGISVNERFRLAGIDAPESRTKDLQEKAKGLLSTVVLSEFLASHDNRCVIVTQKDEKGKFGRYLCTLLVRGEHSGMIDINAKLVETGHAVWKDY